MSNGDLPLDQALAAAVHDLEQARHRMVQVTWLMIAVTALNLGSFVLRIVNW